MLKGEGEFGVERVGVGNCCCNRRWFRVSEEMEGDRLEEEDEAKEKS